MEKFVIDLLLYHQIDIWWFPAFYLVYEHVTAVAFGLYVHRYVAHSMYSITYGLDCLFRLVIWSRFPMGLKWAETYASNHLKHHATSDTQDDPHSPYFRSLKDMCDNPVTFDIETYKKYSKTVRTPRDWIQKVLYEKHGKHGILVWYALSFTVFGLLGVGCFYATRYLFEKIIRMNSNYIQHKIGFSYVKTKGHDRSKILFPIGILWAGEELHANHHNNPKNPKFSRLWFEIDMGWMYLKILSMLGLIAFKKEK